MDELRAVIYQSLRLPTTSQSLDHSMNNTMAASQDDIKTRAAHCMAACLKICDGGIPSASILRQRELYIPAPQVQIYLSRFLSGPLKPDTAVFHDLPSWHQRLPSNLLATHVMIITT